LPFGSKPAAEVAVRFYTDVPELSAADECAHGQCDL